MQLFARIKETILYTWHGNDTVRDRIKNLTCPCFGCCYMIRDADMTCTRVKKRAKRAKRNAITSQIEHDRRVRRLANRKRSISVDESKRRWNMGRTIEACNQQQNSILAQLPPELRLRIYELCFEGQEGWEVHIHPNHYYYAGDHLRLRAEHECHTALLRTCRMIYREAIATLYFSNTFAFYHSQYLFAFTQTTLPQRLAVIRRVTFATALHSRELCSREFHSLSTRFLHETHEVSDVWLLLGRMAQLKTVGLRYTIADIEYWRHPVRRHFAMLEDSTKMTEERAFDVFYKIETRFEIEEGRMRSDGEQGRDLLFGQWRVDEWTRIGRKDE